MNVDPEKFTELGISAIQEMANVAKRNGQQEVEVWHLLSVLMNHPSKLSCRLMVIKEDNRSKFAHSK